MENMNFDQLVDRYIKELEMYHRQSMQSNPQTQQIFPEQIPQMQQEDAVQMRPAPQIREQQPSLSGEQLTQLRGDSKFENYLNENPQTGYLKVQVFTGRGTIPIEKATVTVSKDIDGQRYELASLTTDENGSTEKISLPTPYKSLSEQPGNYKPYATYDVRTQYPDFKIVNNMSVPVFEGIVSLQNVNLTPLIEGNSQTEEFFYESENEGLL